MLNSCSLGAWALRALLRERSGSRVASVFPLYRDTLVPIPCGVVGFGTGESRNNDGDDVDVPTP